MKRNTMDVQGHLNRHHLHLAVETVANASPGVSVLPVLGLFAKIL